MIVNIQNVLYTAAAVVLIFGGIFILRGFLKFTWKLIRTGLILVILVLIAGILIKFININLP